MGTLHPNCVASGTDYLSTARQLGEKYDAALGIKGVFATAFARTHLAFTNKIDTPRQTKSCEWANAKGIESAEVRLPIAIAGEYVYGAN